MSRGKTMRRVVLPQAMRVIVPPTGNETIAMVKDTSLLIAIPLIAELFFQLPSIGSRTFQIIPGARRRDDLVPHRLLSVLMVGQYCLERTSAAASAAMPKKAKQQITRTTGAGGALMTEHDQPTATADGDQPLVHAVNVTKAFHGTEVLKGIDMDVRRGEVVVPARALRVGQDDLPALHQPARDDRRRPDLGRRRPDGLRGPRRQAAPPAPTSRSPPSAATSAWSSSGSTSSRT